MKRGGQGTRNDKQEQKCWMDLASLRAGTKRDCQDKSGGWRQSTLRLPLQGQETT